MTDQPAAAGVPHCYRHPDRETYLSCQRCGRPICPDCMHDAAVGFQCPECVKQGRAETRSGLATYGGRRSSNPAATSIALILLNAAVWLGIVATGGSGSPWVDRLALLPRGMCDGPDGYYFPKAGSEQICDAIGSQAQWIDGVASGAWWQLLTSAFTHVEIWHIGANMLALWFLGPTLESILGRTRFLAVYLLSALTASAVVYVFAAPTQTTLGASGAIFGIFGAILVLAHKQRADMSQLVGLVALNFLITFTVPGISWQGHVGGFLGGVATAAILAYAPRTRRRTWQWLGLSLVLALTLVAFAVRTAALV